MSEHKIFLYPDSSNLRHTSTWRARTSKKQKRRWTLREVQHSSWLGAVVKINRELSKGMARLNKRLTIVKTSLCYQLELLCKRDHGQGSTMKANSQIQRGQAVIFHVAGQGRV